MKVSVEWLREYVELPDCADELVDVLPMLGIEVEEDEEDAFGHHRREYFVYSATRTPVSTSDYPS